MTIFQNLYKGKKIVINNLGVTPQKRGRAFRYIFIGDFGEPLSPIKGYRFNP